MRSRLLRPFLILEFVLSVQVLLTAWAQIGGQSHLDLVYWPWKLGLTLIGALLIVGITVEAVEPGLRARIVVYALLLAATVAMAGMMSYQAHLNEPDESDSDEMDPGVLKTGYYQTRQDFSPRTIA